MYVDVWYGTDPLTPGPGTWEKVLSLGQDANSITVSAPVADTYYWQVELYFGGNTSTPAYTGTVFEFTVIDTDADGLPDEYELLYTDPPSGTAMDPNEDLEPDGLVNLAEYNLGTIPDNPDTDGDTLLDGPELSGFCN